MPSVLLEDLLPVREPVSGWISASTAHRALKPFRTIREMRIYVGTGACIQEGGACVRGLKRGEREKRVKYNFKEEGTGMRVYNEKDNLCPGTSAV